MPLRRADSVKETPVEESHQRPSKGRQTVIVAGATGFLGSAIGEALGHQHHLIALSRSRRAPPEGYQSLRTVDLFSRRDTGAALAGADMAIYLVHSMMPAARLVQAHFRDLDLLCADNFARAAAAHGVRHIIYVSGLIPAVEQLSAHLESRLEVERVLGQYGVPVTALRAGLVVGANGSSFQILTRLVRRLPVMVCPSWTNTRTQPVALDDVVTVIGAVLASPGEVSHSYDLGADEVLTYRELMAETARLMGLTPRMVSVPILSPKLSYLWVCLTTGAPGALVAPLIESLAHEMVARTDPAHRHPADPKTSVEDMLKRAFATTAAGTPLAFRGGGRQSSASTVLSVQRMKIADGLGSDFAADEYLRWLPGGLGLIPISVSTKADRIEFSVLKKSAPLLLLQRRTLDDAENREVFRVVGGMLAKETERGRLEFRTMLDGRTLLVGVHEFEPRLPWWIYRVTQAWFHRWVMYRFARHLEGVETPRG